MWRVVEVGLTTIFILGAVENFYAGDNIISVFEQFGSFVGFIVRGVLRVRVGLSWIKREGGGIHFLHIIQIFFSFCIYSTDTYPIYSSPAEAFIEVLLVFWSFHTYRRLWNAVQHNKMLPCLTWKRKQNFPSYSSSCWFFLFLDSWMTVLSIPLSSVPLVFRFGQVVESIRCVCCTTPRMAPYCVLCEYRSLESQ